VSVLVWLGSAPPERSIRWLDGALAAAATLARPGAKEPRVHALAAGAPTWLDLAADRATRAGVGSVGVTTDLALDYLGWGQVVAAVARMLDATTVLVDEASRPARVPEVAAIAEHLDYAQVTQVVALARDGQDVHASRAAARTTQRVRLRGPAVIGVRIAGPAIEDYPTPTPSTAMRRLALEELGVEPSVLARRALPPRANREPRRTVAEVAEHLAVHVVPRPGGGA